MRSARGLPAALLAVLAIAFAAGCGGGDDTERDNAYVEQLNAAQAQFADTVERLDGRVTEDSSPSADRKTLGSFTDAVDGAVVDLRDIRPPEEVASLHAGLVGDFENYADEVRNAADSLTSGDADRLVASQQRLLKATDTISTQINETIHDINVKLQSG